MKKLLALVTLITMCNSSFACDVNMKNSFTKDDTISIIKSFTTNTFKVKEADIISIQKTAARKYLTLGNKLELKKMDLENVFYDLSGKQVVKYDMGFVKCGNTDQDFDITFLKNNKTCTTNVRVIMISNKSKFKSRVSVNESISCL